MSGKLSYMQGVSGHIEKHYEAMSYYHQDKKICYYCKNGKCSRTGSNNNTHLCIGYTKCSDFISEETYNQKLAKKNREQSRKKQKQNRKKQKQNHPAAVCYTKVTDKRCKKTIIFKKNKS